MLNQTSRGGLAGTVADELRSSGWQVPAVGNFRGDRAGDHGLLPRRGRGGRAGGRAGPADPPRVRPRFGNLSTTRLTVVVTDSYPA